MQTFRRSIFFLAAFVVGAGVLLAFLHQMGLFEVRAIPVELVGSSEGSRLRAEQLAGAGLKTRAQAAMKKFAGKRVWEIDLVQVRAALAKDEWIRDVLISRSFPNEIRVRVKPKLPVAVLVSKKGDFLPVTDESEVLGALPATLLPDVPLMRGETFERDKDRRESAVRFLLALNDKGVLSRRNVSEIGWSLEDGYTLTLINPKVEVKLGEDRIDLKALRASQVLSYLEVNKLNGRIVDASFSKKVLVRLRKGP